MAQQKLQRIRFTCDTCPASAVIDREKGSSAMPGGWGEAYFRGDGCGRDPEWKDLCPACLAARETGGE